MYLVLWGSKNEHVAGFFTLCKMKEHVTGRSFEIWYFKYPKKVFRYWYENVLATVFMRQFFPIPTQVIWQRPVNSKITGCPKTSYMSFIHLTDYVEILQNIGFNY